MDFRASEFLIPIFDFDILNMQVNTPLFILALLLLVMFSMNKLLFQPVLKTLDARSAYLSGLNEDVAREKGEIQRLVEDYEQKLEQALAQVAQLRQEARKETQEAVDAIIYKARQEADAELRRALSELEQEVEQAKAELGRAAGGLAEQTANRILSA
ncbi:MAG: ATP synthase F0 subunit B [SAR324 cluster bacterium]|nr:ATP synthase F0 subunit B [SAR324 cluster bacterium]